MKMIEYRTDFIFWSFVSLVWTGFNFFFFFVITDLSQTIAGWTKPEMFVLVSTFTIIDAIVWSFFYRNMFLYTRSIFDGSLDLVLTKPIDPQYLLSVQDNSYTNVFRLLVGIGALFVSISYLDVSITLLHLIGYLVMLMISLLLLYSLWFIVASFAFWIEKLDNINEIIPALRDFYRVPRGVYSGVFSFLFTILFPLILITSVPSEVLLGRGEWQWIVFHLVSAFGFFVLARLFFQFSIRKYASVGS